MGDGNRSRLTAGDVNSESTHGQGGVMGASGKVLFTATQWQELERQNKIYMYIMASVPIPPQLLSPSSLQSNRVSSDLRFSNGSDPEPWRCRRTDGKKWRCSKDVAPDQKYCSMAVDSGLKLGFGGGGGEDQLLSHGEEDEEEIQVVVNLNLFHSDPFENLMLQMRVWRIRDGL